MISVNSVLRLTIIGLVIASALGDNCSPRKPRNPHPEASGFQPKYSKSFDGQKLVFAVIGGAEPIACLIGCKDLHHLTLMI